MQKNDELTIEILEDGTIRCESPGSISMANHSGAEAFLKYLATLAGGETIRTKLAAAHDHHHHTLKEDSHDHE